MRLISLLADPRGRVAPRPYIAAGVALLGLKILVDLAICREQGLAWSPFLYFAPVYLAIPGMARGASRAPLALLVAGALPFAWTGLALTLKRLRDADLPLWLTVLFMIPVLNLCLMLIAASMPTREPRPPSGHPQPVSGPTTAVAAPVLLSTLIAVGAVLLSANLSGSYGFGLFVATPFLVGYVSVAIALSHQQRKLSGSLGVAATAGACSALALLAFGLEGLGCVVMALPLTVPLALFGGAVAHAVFSDGSDGSRRSRHARRSACVLPLLIPALVGIERAAPPEPPVEPVVTSVIVAADAATVWRRVIAFPPLAEPDEFLFRAGISYPTSATIDGVGVGAVRHCNFSTGPFVEPITTWDEGRELAFDVTACPEPMVEWSPWPIHPRHLQGFMVSRHGRFRLEALPDGRTLLEGTTWYRHGLWPDTYWRWWSDAIVHRIHRRVLEHVRILSERDAGG